MSYDSWKCRSPDDEYPYDDGEEDPCDHDEYDLDILTGRAFCYRCGEAWYATDEEMRAEAQRQADYWEWTAEQERPWNRFKEWLRSTRLAAAISRWRFNRNFRRDFDDEVPF